MRHGPIYLSLLFALVGIAAAAEPLNVLVLYADDWRHDTMSCAGNPVVKTPAIDKLAEDGIHFTQNCVTTSICGVSRATLFTGQWMSRHGSKLFGMFQTPWSETYPGILRNKGYFVGHVGKWHNGKFPVKEFDFGRKNQGRHWIKSKDGGKPVHVTEQNEKDAMEFLRIRPKDKPFCLTVAFFAPHAEDRNPSQFLPQPSSMDLYKDQEIPVPSNANDASWKRLPPFFTVKNEGRKRYGWRFDTPEKYQSMMKNYYRLCTEVDATCGKLIDELRKQGTLDNTLVIFTTDNGYFHGEHGLADKWYPHQESIRVPLIIRDPRLAREKRGKTNDQFSLSVDLAPTILKAVGAAVPKGMQGRDLSPLYLGDEAPAWRTEFFYEHPWLKNIIPASQALVRKDWKYMYWPDQNVEQIFDLRSDPHEEKDLIKDPKAADKLVEMRKRFKELKAQAR